MAYVNGSATTLADLLTALQDACTANGWTLAGNVLHKGDCYVQVTVVDGYLVILGGTGIDGSNALTGAGPYVARIGLAWTDDTMTFPVDWAVHIGTTPDEVYLLINYESTRWQWMAFGCSPVAGLPGTGGWYGASVGRSISPYPDRIFIGPSSGGNGYGQSMGLFWSTAVGNNQSFVHHGLDGNTWSGDSAVAASGATAAAVAVLAAQPLVARQPSLWNGESVLIPIQPHVARGSSKVSMLCDLSHSRYIRDDNYADGELITLGVDQWKVYPWHQKNAGTRDGGGTITHTGTLGWAIRYDGG